VSELTKIILDKEFKEPEGWMRCPQDGRRRPNGDKSKEYVNP
jgi:hypothetical protein